MKAASGRRRTTCGSDSCLSATLAFRKAVENPSLKAQLIAGWASLAMGLFAGAMIHLHPEGLRAPAWVAYAAAGGFVLAGASLLAGALGGVWLQRWLGVVICLTLFSISFWIAFGPGARECTMSLGFLERAASEALCQGAFGVGAILVALLMGLGLCHAVRSRHRKESSK